MAKKITRKELVAAGKELNDLLFADDPQIDTKLKADELTNQLKEAAGELDPSDELTETTIAILVAIGAELPKDMGDKAATATKDESESDDEDSDDSDTSEEDVKLPSDTMMLKAAKTINKLPGMNSPIDMKLENKELAAAIRGNADIITTDDKLNKATREVLEALGVEIGANESGKKAGKTAAKSDKKAGKSAGKKPDAKKAAQKNHYGHRLGTMTDIIDNCLAKGTTEKDCVKAILKAFPEKSESAAKAKFAANVKAFEKEVGIAISHNEKTGIYKVAKESI